MAIVRCKECGKQIDLDHEGDTFDFDTSTCEACQGKAEEAYQREKDDSLTEDRPLVSYHHTRQAMIDAGMSERDFA